MTISSHLKKGFSLTEILVVIAIVGILVAIGVPALNNLKSGTEEIKLRATKGLVAQAAYRAYQKDKSVTGPVTLSQISPFINIQGRNPSTWDEVFQKSGLPAPTTDQEALEKLFGAGNYTWESLKAQMGETQ
jgi:prepilin-type N-terminal cleavage/methylation domain-containing protein